MPNYCALDDVQKWLPAQDKVDNQTGNPVGATVTGWCGDVTAQVNVAFSTGPATAPTSGDLFTALKMMCAKEIAYQVMAVRAAVRGDKVKPLYELWHEEFLQMLKDIAEGKGVFAAVSGVTPSLGAPDQEPKFTRDMIF